MAILAKQLPKWKTEQVEDIAGRIKNAKTVALVDIKGMPGKQFHELRSKLREKFNLQVIRKTILKFAIEKAKSEKKNLEELEENLGEMPAIIMSDADPFKISKLLSDNKAPSFAKAGDIAPSDIVIDEGPTPFAPGPMISELSRLGLKVKVEAGKIAVQQKSTLVKAGDPISADIASLLVKLSVQPMEVGLELESAWEQGFVFKKDLLRFDVGEYMGNLAEAASMAFMLSIGAAYPTSDNISILVSKAYNEAKVLALEKDIFVDALVPQLLVKASAQASELSGYVDNYKPAEKETEERPAEDITEGASKDEEASKDEGA